ncbi:recombinase family protein [Streptomyces sp. NPDC088768]|uniref:recombinase family protein n=1 Tax=Streptomyces sp. NPDC088768 TaxID=3365894 RepID=UPI0038291172
MTVHTSADLREDAKTLKALGFEDGELAELGLERPAVGPPDSLAEVYLRRSKKNEDLATLRGHLRDMVAYLRDARIGIRHVWFEQRSASKLWVHREEFDKATGAVMDGLSKTLAVWKTDRFDRRGMGAIGSMLDRFDTRRAGLVSVVERLDSRQPGARMIFGILAERAREEAKDIRLRVEIGHRSHKADNGRGTGRPPFGTRSPRLPNGKPSGRIEVEPTEFETARRLADLLLGTAHDLPGKWARLEGTPVNLVTTAFILNHEGRTTRSGKPWSPSSVSRLAQSPLFAGMVGERERVYDEHGNPTGRWKGQAEPSIDPTTGKPRICGTGVITLSEYYRIRSLISERTDTTLRRGKPGARYLGTGVYRCGRTRTDGSTCRHTVIHRGRMYRCYNRESHGTEICRGISTLAERVDHTVSEAWVRHVTALEPDDPVLHTIGRRWLDFSDPESHAERIAAQEALAAAQGRVKRLEDDYYVAGRLSPERFAELSAQQTATISVLTDRLAALNGERDVTPLLDADLLREAWEGADIPTRRMLLRCTLGPKGIVILPAARPGDPTPMIERLQFDWLSE